MGRAGVSYAEVAKIAVELQGAGINPTVDAVREKLKTGSRSTIGPYLKQWRIKQEENNENAGGLPQELYALTKGLYKKLQESAEAKIMLAESAATTEIASIQEKLTQANSQNASLEKEAQLLSTKVFELTALSEQQSSMLANEQILNLQHLAKIQELETRLQDKIVQIQILEKQLNNVQMNLEHYRESVALQREDDKRSWERETSLLNQEIQELKHQISAVHQSKQVLNQKLETIVQERSQLEKDWYEQRGKTMELQEQLKIKDYSILNWKEKHKELSAINQKLEHHSTQNENNSKQLEKENCVLIERLKLNESILKRSEDALSSLHQERLFLTKEITHLKSEVKKLNGIFS